MNLRFPKIKICGLKNQQLAREAVTAGVNYIGLVFEGSSKRYVNIDEAIIIAAATKEAGGIPVAVFTEHSAEEMESVCKTIHCHTVQCHGELSRKEHIFLPSHFTRIYSIEINDSGNIQNDIQNELSLLDPKRDILLFDGTKPGSGSAINYSSVEKLRTHFRFFLAGGIDCNNVAKLNKRLNPYAFDLSSSVENADGIKEIGLIKTFLLSLRAQRSNPENPLSERKKYNSLDCFAALAMRDTPNEKNRKRK